MQMKGDYYAREFMITRGSNVRVFFFLLVFFLSYFTFKVIAIITRQRGTSNGGFFSKLIAFTQEEYFVRLSILYCFFSKTYFSTKVRISAGEDVAFILACVIVVDKVTYDNRR